MAGRGDEGEPLKLREKAYDAFKQHLLARDILPGQFVSIGAEIDGKTHWRAYSISSSPNTSPRISIGDRLTIGNSVVRYSTIHQPSRRRSPSPAYMYTGEGRSDENFCPGKFSSVTVWTISVLATFR